MTSVITPFVPAWSLPMRWLTGLRSQAARNCAMRVAAWAMAVALIACPTAYAQGQAGEYDVKAAFLFNFAVFTTRAAAQPLPASTPYAICVYGKDVFGPALKSIAGRQIDGRMVAVRQAHTLDELRPCQLVFLGDIDRSTAAKVTSAIAGMGIITVAEVKDFPLSGVVFNLIVADERVAFQVNTVAARTQQLEVSSKLLRLARGVFQ